MNYLITSLWVLPIAALLTVTGCATSGSTGNSPTISQQQASIDRPDTLAETNVKLGIGYLQQGQKELALSRLQRALQLDPNLPSAHNAIAILYDQLGEEGLAAQHYQRAVSLDPQDSRAHNNYGRFLCNRNEYAAAEEQFLLAVKNPFYETPDLAYENAGLCALRVPDLPKGEEYFRTALKLNPKLPSSLYQMASIHFNRSDYLPARAYLQRYENVAKPTAATLWLGIRIERVLGDKNAEASYAVALRSNFPDSEEARKLAESEKP
jgi:type IV pilus assembly protein PilF